MSARRAGALAAVSAPVGVAVGVLVNLVTEVPSAGMVAGLGVATAVAAAVGWLQTRDAARAVVGARVVQRASGAGTIARSSITVRGQAEVEQRTTRRGSISDSPITVTTAPSPVQDRARTWLVAARDEGEFTDRREALAAFDRQARDRVLVYWGMSGQGKSRLLRRLSELHDAEIIDLEWSAGEHLDLAFPLLDRIADVLSGWTGGPMRRFARAREVAERELRAAYEAVPTVQQHAEAGATISHSPITVVTEPAALRAAEVRALHRKALASALADDVRAARLPERVLCIDTVERLRYVDGAAGVPDQQSWVLDDLVSGLLAAAPNLRVVLAGREPVAAELPMTEFELTDWAATDTADYLRSRGVAEPDLHHAVHRVCGGLPGWIGMAADAVLAGERTGNPLTAGEIADAARTEPVHTWLPRIFLSRLVPWLRELVTNSAVPRVVTKEALRALVDAEPPRDWFDELAGYSFVQRHRGERGRVELRLHPLVRGALLEWLDQHEPLRLARLHTRARAYFRTTGNAVESMYHGFAVGDPSEVDTWRAMTNASWQRPDSGATLALADLVLAPECRGQLLEAAPLAVADAELVAGGIAQERHELALADSLLGSSASIAGEAGSDRGVANALLARARLALRQSLLTPAHEHAEAAFALYQRIGDRRSLAVIRELLGDLALRRGELDVAEDHLTSALAGYTEAGEPVGAADTHDSLGTLAKRRGDRGEAERHFTEGLELYRANGRRRGQANMRRRLGDLALEGSELAAAEEHFEAALRGYQELGEDLGVANAHQQLGHLAVRRGRHARARELFATAMEISAEIDDQLGVANAQRGLGAVAAAEGDPVAAHEHFFAALSEYLELDAVVNQAIVWGELAKLAMARGDLADAAQQFALALHAAERGGDLAAIANSKLRLGTIIAGTGRFHEGVAMLEEASAAYDEMGLSNSAAGTLEKLRADFERCSAWIESVSLAAQALLRLLCHLETDDRMAFVVHPAWPVLAPAFGVPAADPEALLTELEDAGLVHVDGARYHVAGDVLLTALAGLDDDVRDRIDSAMATSWAGQLVRSSEEGERENVVRAGLGAAVYLMRQQQWAEAFDALSCCLHEASTEGQRTAVLAHLRRLATLSGQPEIAELVRNPPASRAMTDPAVLAREQAWHDEVGRAKQAGQWRHALAVNAKLLASVRARGADRHEVAYYEFSDYAALMELGRLDECEELLRECEDEFGRAGNADLLGLVFNARAMLAVRREDFAEAVELDRAALAQGYVRPDPRTLVTAHHNTANHMMRANAPVERQCAHRLAAFVLHMLSAEEPDPGTYLGPLAITLRERRGHELPGDVAAVGALVEADGAAFTELVDELCPDPAARAMMDQAIAAAVAATG
ncbi:tetratricopeptide repeat protein [Allokutzneria oryzae]|uniref:Tetratricopeptide repeat protein n=1 Tax=Allokutzneria oryzae TaxID=1378989 RepID=A0ABV6A5G0_9PSEU